MNANVPFEFRWLSPLGISVILFLILGVFNVMIGVLTPVFVRRPDRLTSNIILTSTRPDTALLGASPEDLLAKDRPLGLVRLVLVNWLGAYMLGFGVLQVALAWFGLRAGQSWAFWTLTIGDLAMIPAIWVSLLPFVRVGAIPGLGEMPPFITALILIPIAAVLGWIGLR